MKYTFGFLGCGNMGGALVAAAAKAVEGDSIAICDKHIEKTAKLQAEFGVACVDERTLASECDFVILGVKPQAMQDALSPIADILRAREEVVLVTMAAGLSMAGLATMVGKALPTIRIMPNTPVLVGQGVILYTSTGVRENRLNDFLTAFALAGALVPLPEEQIDGGSALSGSGPAFAYAFAEALIRGGKEVGLDEKTAERLTFETLKGAAEMLLTFGDPEELRKAVCSPNGTTLAGIKALDEGNFSSVASSAITAAYRRALELKK